MEIRTIEADAVDAAIRMAMAAGAGAVDAATRMAMGVAAGADAATRMATDLSLIHI